jgi:PAS domain S-box-containing protein
MLTMWYVLPLVLVASISAALGIFAWRRRSAPGVLSFALLMAAVTLWSVGYALELVSMEQQTKIMLAKVQYLGIVAVPVLWLIFALQYTQRQRWLTRRTLALLTIVPLIIILLVWTNEAHYLIWNTISLKRYGSLSLLDFTYGVGFWINAAYSYLLLLLGTLTLIQPLMRSLDLYRRQTIALLLGASAPWVGNALYIFDLSPWPGLDLTPFAFTFSGLVFAWGLFRWHLLDIGPVARDAVIESMSDGVIVLDAHGRIVDLNPAAQRILGHSAADVIGQPATDVFAEHAGLLAGYRQIIEAREATEARAEVVLHASEQQHFFDLHSSPLYDRKHRIGDVLVLSNVTERKRAEEARAQFIQEQLARAQAEEGIRMRDDLLSIAAHELKTPVTALLGYSQLLQRRLTTATVVSDRDQRSLSIIADQAERLNKLILTLLDLSRLQYGKFSINPQPMDICQLTQRIVEATQLMLERHTVHLTCPDEPVMLEGDELRLEQVLHNLLQNAIKYSPAGGQISVTIERQVDQAYLVVSDQGIGISEAAQAQLFQPFSRIDSVETHHISGFGIGLYLVKEIVMAHGGVVQVISTEGQGSTFTIRLPLQHTLSAGATLVSVSGSSDNP